MRRLLAFLLLAAPAFALPRANGFCEVGNQTITVNTLSSSTATPVMRSYPGCTVAVYLTGTTTPATIYSDNGVTPLANPFTASASTGAWFFYAANNSILDVQMSGGGMPSPFTLGGITLQQSSGTLEDTHANRIANYPAGNYSAGTTFFESDRTVLYLDNGVAWVYVSGVYNSLLANKPADLVSTDAGFLFYSTDFPASYLWGGSSFSIIGNVAVIPLGTHAQRLSTFPPSTLPTQTLYYETDRTVTYLSFGGFWIYDLGIYSDVLANRPSDLGTHDVGFIFYATDISVQYRWNGFSWTLPGTIGVVAAATHAARISTFPPSTLPPQALYWEIDRRVTYISYGNAWNYFSGTMYGALSVRPTDLATLDANFSFYATDVGVTYLWTGSAWSITGDIGTTPNGTHNQRLTIFPPSSLPPYALYYETDRKTSYISFAGNWLFFGGNMTGLFSTRPTDLGANDLGFPFYATDTATSYGWNGSSWVNYTGSGGGSGVSSLTASTGISFSSSTGAVTATNTGVTSIIAGSNITISAATGAVTINATGTTETWTSFSPTITFTGGGSATVSGSPVFQYSSLGRISMVMNFVISGGTVTGFTFPTPFTPARGGGGSIAIGNGTIGYPNFWSVQAGVSSVTVALTAGATIGTGSYGTTASML